MADNTSIRNGSGATVIAATDELSDSSQSPKVTLLAGDGSPVGISPATSGGQTAQGVLLGAVTETAPASDTASSGLNGRLQRIAQRLTSLIGMLPTALGPTAKAGALSVTTATDDPVIALYGAVTETAPASDTASSGLNGRLQRVAQRLTSLIALLPTALGQGTMAQSMRVVLASDQSVIPGYGFDVAVIPAVTAGAYSAGDIVGALMAFAVARVNDEPVVLTGVQIVSKAAVLPSYTLMLFNADPTATTKTDNAVYSLDPADAFKLIKAIPLGASWTDHGTPNSVSLDGLGIALAPSSGGKNVYGLLVDGTGVTLASTSDIQVRLRGIGV